MKGFKRFGALYAAFLVAMGLLVFHLTQPVGADDAPAGYAQLLERVAEEGRLPVIVTLSLGEPFVAEGHLTSISRTTQRANIDQAQKGLLAELEGYNAEVYYIYETIPALALRLDAAAFAVVRKSQWVSYIQEDEAVPPMLASSTALIGAPAVWGGGYDGDGQVVVVLDDGIDSDHPFFAGRIIAEYCFSNNNGTGLHTSLCPNGLGTDTSANVLIPVCSVTGNDGQRCTHGTHVAGIVAGADYSGGPGYNGVAPGVQIIPIQIFTRNSNNDSIFGYSSDQVAALELVYTLQPTVTIAAVNMSLGGGQNFTDCDSDSRKLIIDQLLSVGVATIIASGNNGWSDSIAAPGCISTAVTVGATNDNDVVANFSNSNFLIDLLAPGVAIDASVPIDSYGSKNGTSMATPHVAGAWAVLKQAAPSATPAEILAALQQYGISVTDHRNGLVRSRIQLDRAAAALQPAVWEGDTDDWHEAFNWSTGSLPRCGTPITIPTTPTGGNFPTITADAAVGTVTITDGAQLTMDDHTLTVCGDWLAEGTGQFNGTGGTVLFASGTNQTITLPAGSNGQFYNVQIGDGGTPLNVVLNSDVEVAGNMTFVSPAVLDGNGRTLSIAGDWLDYGSGFAPNGGTVVFNSPATQSVGNTTIELLNIPFSEADGQTGFSAGYLPTGWVGEQATGSGFLGGDITSYGGNGGAAVRWDNSPSAWLHTAALTLQTGTTYELEYKYRLLFASATNPQNFAVYLGTSQNSADMTTLLHQVNNVSAATFATATATFTVSSSGQYHLGLYAERNNESRYAVIDDVIVRATSGRNQFYNVRIDQGTTAFAHDLVVENDLTIAEGADLTVEGAVANNGRFRQTLNVPNSATTAFLHIQNAAADEDKYFGVEITPTSGDMGSVEVVIRGGQTCGTSGNLSAGVQRCYDITPTTSQAATIRFYYRDVEANGNSAPTVYHYSGSGSVWEPESGITHGGSGEGLWAQATDIGAYSPFALADAAPTAVRLLNITTTTPVSGGFLPLLLLLSLSSLYAYRRRTG